jgi:H+-translocating NAD(P) transhydrogenase subunit alpha
MKIAVPRERAPGETRVALVPDAVATLVKRGLEVGVETGAGGVPFPDELYESAGATIHPTPDALYAGADVVLRVRPLGTLEDGRDEIEAIAPGTVVIGFFNPLMDAQGMLRLAERGLSAFAMELVPRTTRAQFMDVLSSMSTVAGYKAILLAADRLPRFFPLLTTAAGTIPPAKVLVLGAGVAGLQAIATARRLGAMVTGFDVRAAAREQVESLGASFLEVEMTESAEGEGGYAKEVGADLQQRIIETVAKKARESDVVITTALIPGKPAPLLLPAETVAAMKPGSVIVDLAAEAGGNCALTRLGEEIVEHGVLICGPANLAGGVPVHASQMYARNISALLLNMTKDDELNIDFEDEITAGCCVTHGGEVVHPAVRAKLDNSSIPVN